MLLTPGSRSPCARSGDITVPIANPVTKTITVRIAVLLESCVKRLRISIANQQSPINKSPMLLLATNLRDDLEVLVVLVAHVLEQFGVGPQDEWQHDVPRLGVGAGIIDRDEDVHVPEVLAHELLGDSQLVCRRLAEVIEPALVVEPGGFDDEGVLVPPPDGIPEPRWVHVLR